MIYSLDVLFSLKTDITDLLDFSFHKKFLSACYMQNIASAFKKLEVL